MSVRRYAPTDLDRCRFLWAEMVQYHRDLYDDPTIGGEAPELGFDEHLRRVGAERIWVATCEGRIAGLTSLVLNEQEAEVEPIIVSEEFRSRGIGRDLMQRAIEEAERLGVLCLSVKPVARNEDAVSFFYRAGFTVLGHVQLVKWLGTPSPGQWRSGPELFGKRFSF